MANEFGPDGRARVGRSRRALWAALACALAVLGFFGFTAARIAAAATGDKPTRADAIIVFGAAEYAGRPSPVYRARLDHAFQLFQAGAAPVVITTGGQGADPHFSEGGVGRDYLISLGIPDIHLIAETQGSDTAESAERVAVIMRANRMRSARAVSDAYHIFRIKKLMEREGITAYGDPRPNSWPRTVRGKVGAVGREVASYTLWRLHLN